MSTKKERPRPKVARGVTYFIKVIITNEYRKS